MQQFNDLKDYLEVKGLKGMEVQFEKSAVLNYILVKKYIKNQIIMCIMQKHNGISE